MQDFLDILKFSAESDAVLSLAFIALVIATIYGINRGLWPFISEQWWPWYQERHNMERKQLEILEQVAINNASLTQYQKLAINKLDDISNRIVACEKISDAMIEKVSDLIDTGVFRKKKKSITRHDIFAQIMDEDNSD